MNLLLNLSHFDTTHNSIECFEKCQLIKIVELIKAERNAFKENE
jgi:hypothetical protein